MIASLDRWAPAADAASLREAVLDYANASPGAGFTAWDLVSANLVRPQQTWILGMMVAHGDLVASEQIKSPDPRAKGRLVSVYRVKEIQ